MLILKVNLLISFTEFRNQLVFFFFFIAVSYTAAGSLVDIIDSQSWIPPLTQAVLRRENVLKIWALV